MAIALVVVLGFLAFAVVHWGKQKASGIVIGVLFGLALATTALGPPLTDGTNRISEAIWSAITQAGA